MPLSKRARLVHESKTSKKNHKEQTRRLFANIRESVEKYDHLFVFSVDNMRNTYLKDVRTEFSDGRYVLFVHLYGRSLTGLLDTKTLLRQDQSHGRRPRQHSRDRIRPEP